jgi:hypothetical protein
VRSSLRLLAGAALPLLALAGGRTDAGAASHRAALVIEHSNGSLVERCVAFAAEAISGLQLIQLAQVEYRTQGFGDMGQAVCQLDFEPAQVPSNCFGSGSDPSWEYYRETSSGWSLSGSGASGSAVHDGDVDGWHYAAGPKPPPRVALSQVCTPPAAAAAGHVAAAPAVAVSAHQAAARPTSGQAPATEVSDAILYHPPMRALSILPARPRSAASGISPPVDPRAAAVFSAAALLLGMSLLYGWRRRAP